VSATNGHDVAFSWEEDFDSWFEWDNAAAANAAAAADAAIAANILAAPIWNQEAWEEHEDAVAAADALEGYMERNNAAAAAANALAPHRPRWNGADWDEHDWEEEDLPLVQKNHAGSPQSVHSSMPGLETVPPTPSPSPPPLQLKNLLDPLPPHQPERWQVTVRPDAPPPTLDQMVLWNANIRQVPAGGGAARPTYAIQANDIVFRLPAGTGVHVRYHSSFSDGTTEQPLHRQPLEERLTLLHQLRNVLLTVGEEQQILADMEPMRRSSAFITEPAVNAYTGRPHRRHSFH
jgi:hypothetical protein